MNELNAITALITMTAFCILLGEWMTMKRQVAYYREIIERASQKYFEGEWQDDKYRMADSPNSMWSEKYKPKTRD